MRKIYAKVLKTMLEAEARNAKEGVYSSQTLSFRRLAASQMSHVLALALVIKV